MTRYWSCAVYTTHAQLDFNWYYVFNDPARNLIYVNDIKYHLYELPIVRGFTNE